MPAQEFSDTILSVNAIHDYRVCELYYDFKYVEKEYAPELGRELNAQKFENTLKKIVSFFFYKRQDGVVPSYNSLLNRWEKLWYPKETDAYDLAVEKHEIQWGNNASYTTAATAALLQFYEDFSGDPSVPILIDDKFLIPIDKQTRLAGSIDLVLRFKDTYHVIKWSARQVRPTKSKMVLDFAAQKMAFDYRNDTPKQVKYSMYDLGSTRAGFVPVNPKMKDVDALKFWAQDIIDTNVYVPRRGFTTYCKSCPYDAQCSKFEFPKVENG